LTLYIVILDMLYKIMW